MDIFDIILARQGNSGGDDGGGVLRVNATYDEATYTVTLNKTWQEIHDADLAVVISETGEFEYLAKLDSGETYYVYTYPMYSGGGTLITYSCASAEDYPYYED